MAKAKRTKPKSKVPKKWPLERDVMFRPGRFTYIAGQTKRAAGNSCVFCEALAQGLSAETLVVAETALTMVVLNKYPYNPGHLLVLPKRHHGDFLSLKKQEYEELMSVVRLSVEAIKKAYNTEDFNIGINLGKVAGAGIPGHLHVHIVPRWPSDLNFFHIIANTKAVPTDLPTVYARLAPVFKELLPRIGDF